MNPFAFRPAQVTIWTTIVYLALLIPIIILNETVPPAPSGSQPYAGVNLTESWHDLATLTQGYHPYNSHKNDDVRNWLLLRIQQILDGNGADWVTEHCVSKKPSNYSARALRLSQSRPDQSDHGVTVFNDQLSNVTVRFGGLPGSHTRGESESANAAYFEGTNVMVYIRGVLDEEGEWWKRKRNHFKLPIGKGGVLVNAHYDSVSTGFGATDDGMGVVTILQLIKHFTTPGQQPKHGIIALLNNGEEDFLYGSLAFGNSPLLPFVHTFLNLEGAGAGGRATLFRGSDMDVISAYAKSPNPFSTVISSDSFSLGVIKSQTDYVVFNGVYGQRGLDLAFYRPRARYHTKEDDLRHASRASLWHMLSSSIATIQALSDKTFSGAVSDDTSSVVPNGRGSKAVWFDLFGKGFVLFKLRAMFAWSLTLLIATPLILMLLAYILQKREKCYFFSNSVNPYEQPGPGPANHERVKIGGLRGIFRFPLAIGVSGALVSGAAFLVRKFNPYIIHSSEYSVWAMFVSLGYFAFWCIMRGAHVARPSALHRGYVNIWLFTMAWATLVAVTVFEDRFDIAAGFPFVFLHSALFLTTVTSFLELFALPDMKTYGQQVRAHEEEQEHQNDAPSPDAVIAPEPNEVDGAESDETADDASEGDGHDVNTPLIGRNGRGEEPQTTFAIGYRRSITAFADSATKRRDPDSVSVGGEQPWSKNLPSWAWLFQFLILGPFMIILTAQNGLFLVDAVHQTAIEGSATILPYILVAAFTILLILPLMPFIHRITYHIPLFLLCVFTATLVYNLVAFPFSQNNKYKAFWQQTVDLDTGESIVKLGGVEEYLRLIISDLPSAAGKNVTCQPSRTRVDVSECVYDGRDIAPNVVNNVPDGVPPALGSSKLVDLDVAGTGPGQAKFTINAKNTKSCVLKFARPIKNFFVAGSAGWDNRFGALPAGGIDQVLLWRRDWNKTWEVDVEWDSAAADTEYSHYGFGGQTPFVSPTQELKRNIVGMDGNITCIWSDINTPGTIPALDEAIQYAPSWAVMTKFAAGLVEGSKSFKI